MSIYVAFLLQQECLEFNQATTKSFGIHIFTIFCNSKISLKYRNTLNVYQWTSTMQIAKKVAGFAICEKLASGKLNINNQCCTNKTSDRNSAFPWIFTKWNMNNFLLDDFERKKIVAEIVSEKERRYFVLSIFWC